MKRIYTLCIMGILVSIIPLLNNNDVDAAQSSGWTIAQLLETDNAGDATYPQVAFDTVGNAITVWYQSDGTRNNIWSKRYTADVGWDTAQLIETDNTGSAYNPQVALDTAGNAIAVWMHYDGTRYNIWSNHYIPGVGWGTTKLIETDNAGSATYPQLAVDMIGNAIAVWHQSDSIRNNIWSNHYIAGMGWGTAQLIETGNAGDAENPKVAVDPAGNALAVWYQDDGTRNNIYSNRYTAGVGWGTAQLIETDNAGSATYPQVAVDPAGNALAVWYQDDGTRSNIYSNRYTAGVGWGTAELIETDNAGNAILPQVAIDPNGNAIAVWYQYDGTRNNICSNRYTAGVGWGTAELIETNDGYAYYPQIAVDTAGNAIAVWEQYDGPRMHIWSNRYATDVGWGIAELIETDNAGNAERPEVAVDTAGNAIAVWQQSDSVRTNIWSNRFINPDTTPPTLTISDPTDGSVTEVLVVTVSGTTEPGAILNINGAIAYVADDGSFSLNIALFSGANTVTVTSTDASGNSASETRTVTYEDPVPDLIAELQSLTDTLSSLEGDLGNAEDEIEAIEDILASLQENQTLTAENMASLFENMTALKEALNASEDVTLLELLASLEENLTDMAEEMKDLRTDQGALGDDLADIEEDLVTIEDDLDAVETRQGELRDDVDRIDSEQGPEEPKDLTVTMIVLFIVNLLLFLFLAILVIILFIVKKGRGNRKEDSIEE